MLPLFGSDKMKEKNKDVMKFLIFRLTYPTFLPSRDDVKIKHRASREKEVSVRYVNRINIYVTFSICSCPVKNTNM